MNFFLIYHRKCKNQVKYFTLILLFSGDISLIPGPPHSSQYVGLSRNVFDKKGLHFLHTNVNTLLPKTEEIRFITKKSKATVIGITKTKLDGIIFDVEIYIEGLRQKSWRCGMLCKTWNQYILSKKIEVTFVDFLLPKTKSVSVGKAYRPSKDANFLELFAEILNSLNILENEMLVLSGINVYISCKMV